VGGSDHRAGGDAGGARGGVGDDAGLAAGPGVCGGGFAGVTNHNNEQGVQSPDAQSRLHGYHQSFPHARITELASIDKYFATLLVGTIAGLSLVILKGEIGVFSLPFLLIGLAVLFLGILNISYRFTLYHICLSIEHSHANVIRTLLRLPAKDGIASDSQCARRFEKLYTSIVQGSSQELSSVVDYMAIGYACIGLGVITHAAQSYGSNVSRAALFLCIGVCARLIYNTCRMATRDRKRNNATDQQRRMLLSEDP